MFFCHLFYRGDACLVLLLLLSFSIIFTSLYKSPYLPWFSSRHKLNIAILILQYFSIVSLFLNGIWYLYSGIVGLPKIWQKVFLTKQIRLYARTNPGIVRKQMLEINIFRRDFSTRQSEIFFYKILLHNNLTHLLRKMFSKTFLYYEKNNSCKGFKLFIFGLSAFLFTAVFEATLSILKSTNLNPWKSE